MGSNRTAALGSLVTYESLRARVLLDCCLAALAACLACWPLTAPSTPASKRRRYALIQPHSLESCQEEGPFPTCFGCRLSLLLLVLIILYGR